MHALMIKKIEYMFVVELCQTVKSVLVVTKKRGLFNAKYLKINPSPCND